MGDVERLNTSGVCIPAAVARRSRQFRIQLLMIPSLGGVERKLADLKVAHYMDAPAAVLVR